jgi:Peptidase family C25
LSFSYAQPSVLAAGKWYKISVQADGIYQINHALLKKLGIDPSKVNPTTLKLYGYPNGMLPQANSATRQKDLREMAIMVTGESDGKFNSDDRIIFYGQGPDAHYYDPAKETFWYENNLYTDKNFYFITFGGSNGKRATNQTSVDGTFPTVNTFTDFVQFEEDTDNILNSGREWFGFQLGSTSEATVEFSLSGVVKNSEITLISKVMARAFAPASFNVFYNNVQVGTQEIAIVTNSTYALKGRMKSDTLHFNANTVNGTATTHRIKYQFVRTDNSVGFLDNFLVSMERNLALYGSNTIATLTDGLNNPAATIEITANEDLVVLDVTDPFEIKNQEHAFASSKISFNMNASSIKRIGLYRSAASLDLATAEGSVPNQNLQTVVSPNLIIITHPTLVNQAERLVDHRQSFSSISSAIVTPQQIYNEYSGGRQDVSAIRDFIRDVYQKSGGSLQYVLLFGRASYDYKDREVGNTNLVPTYESRNSLSPLETYSSDDFYGFLEGFEGEWSESSSFNHTLDVGIGRLPAITEEDAQNFVNKLIEYDTHPKARGQWRSEIVFAADDGDGNLHQRDANKIANYVEAINPGIHAKKVYLDLYTQVQKSFGQISPEGTNHLYRAFHEGALIVNFTGHGSEQLWMQERMLDPVFVATTQNRYKYPLLITATCEFGRCDDPGTLSSAEKLLTRKNAGTIGLVSTSRPVNSSTNYELNYDFYDAFLNDETSKGKPIGTVFRTAKNKGTLGIANRNFSLLGDPSMSIGPPQNEVVITSLENSLGQSIIEGLGTYTIQGEIRQDNAILSDFNGVAEIKIYQKAETKITKGDENSPFQFTEHTRQIFQGKAQIQNGVFEAQFVAPEIIDVNTSIGRLIVYALSNDDRPREALGNSTVSIGNSNSLLTDTEPPTISLFMNDTTFVNGGISNENPFLVAMLEDNIAIDISGHPAKPITAMLDGDSTFIVTSYYQAESNQPNKGKVNFQLFDLSKGKHTIQLTAFDVAGNTSTSKVNFVVGEQNSLVVSKVFGWPNPFQEQVKIGFYQNRSGEDLQGALTICTSMGQPVHHIEFEAPASPFSTQILEWDGTTASGAKLPAGLYILRLSVRSLQDGSKSEVFGKLILSN